MITLLLLAILLLASPAWAGETPTRTDPPFSIDRSGGIRPLAEPILPQYSSDGYLKVTKESLDALLRDHPDAHVRVMPVDPCLAKMEALLRQLESDFDLMEKQRITVPLWELHAMLQRRPMWTDTRRECLSKP